MRTLMMTCAVLVALTPALAGSPSRSAVIFIPGLLGSFLRDTVTKKRVFVTVPSVLWGAQPLSLEQSELQTLAGPELEPDGVVDEIPAIVTTVDVYGSMLRKLETLPGRLVVPFAYDWRKGPFEAVVQLGRQIDDLKAHGISQIDIVAHSAGGWLTTYYLAYGTQNPSLAKLNWAGATHVRHAVIIGTPYRGSMALFREMARGTSLPMMGRFLPADTYATFPSTFLAVPQGPGHFINAEGKVLSIGLGDPATWTNYRFGLMARTDLPAPVLAARAAYISEQLRASQEFLALLGLPEAGAHPWSLKVMNVIGRGTPTLDKAYVINGGGGDRLILDVDHPKSEGLSEAAMFADGDGIVTVSSSVMPEALRAKAKLLISTAPHDNLTQTGDVQAAVLKFLK